MDGFWNHRGHRISDRLMAVKRCVGTSPEMSFLLLQMEVIYKSPWISILKWSNDLDLVVPPWLRTPPIWGTTAKWTYSRLGKCCYLTGRLFGKGSNWWTWCMFRKMLQEILIWLWVNLEVYTPKRQITAKNGLSVISQVAKEKNGLSDPRIGWKDNFQKTRCLGVEIIVSCKKDLTPIRWWSKYIKMIGKIPILRVTISIFMNFSPCLQVKNRHFGLAQAISMVSSDGRKHGELRVQLEGPSFRVLPRISPENGRVLLDIYIYII